MSKAFLRASIRGGLIKQRSTSITFRNFRAIAYGPDPAARFNYSTSPPRAQKHLFNQDMEAIPRNNRVEEQSPTKEPEVEEVEEVEEEYIPIIEKWGKVIDAIENTTKESLASSPPFEESSPSIYQAYWRDAFCRLRDSVVADQTIPEFLTDPPVKKFTITFMDVIHGLACACCHVEVEPNIILENAIGVTKTDLMDAVIKQLYGEKLPRVYMEPDYLFDIHDREPTDIESDDEEGDSCDDVSFTENSGVVVYYTSWISSSFEEEGNVAYSNEPQLYFYCCKPERYDETKKDHENAIKELNKHFEEQRRRQSEAAMKSD